MKNTKMMVMLVLAILGSIIVSSSVSAVSLTASLNTYEPLPAVPGRTVDVWVTILNNGDQTARDVKVEFADSNVFSLTSEADRVKNIPLLGTRNTYLVKYSLKVADTAPDGENDMILKYSSSTDAGVVYENKIGIEVKSTEVPLTISAVSFDPQTISPGSSSKLALSLKNLAKSSSIRDVTVDLQLTTIALSTTIVDLPFVPVGSSTQKTIESIGAGQTSVVEFELAAYPDAEAKIYKVPITITFDDDSGTSYEKTLLIGVEVNSPPDLLLTIESSDITTSKLSGEVNFDITNKGLADMKLMTVTLEESDEYKILSPSNKIYIGNIDSDDYESASFDIQAKEAGIVKLPVVVEFKDSLNKKYESKYELEYEIKDAPNGNGGSSGTIIVVVLVVVIVGVVLYRRNKKKKQQKR